MASGQWITGQWTVESRQWTRDNGQCTRLDRRSNNTDNIFHVVMQNQPLLWENQGDQVHVRVKSFMGVIVQAIKFVLIAY